MIRSGCSHPRDNNLPVIYLKPSELSVCTKPTKVVTVLGSCVSITMFNRRLRLGAICHAALPRSGKGGPCTGYCAEAFKFVNCSIRYLIEAFRLHKISGEEIEVKLFGGADTLASKRENAIGSRNVKTALHMLREENLKVVAADVGDSFGRKLIFYTHTGEVFLKRLKNTTNPAAGR